MLAAAVSLLGLAAFVAPASADQDIASAGPLTHIYVGSTLQCQVDYLGDTSHEFFPPSTVPGNCFTRIRTANFQASLTPINQTAVTGSGTVGSPYTVVTLVTAQASADTFELIKTDTYVVGRDFYRSDVTVRNTGNASVSAVLSQGADCYLQNSDSGYGFYDTATGGIYCSANANNSPPARIEGFVPLSAGSRYFEGGYSTATAWPEAGGFPNTCLCDQLIDNGMALSWNIDNLAVGASTTRSFLTTFSPQGEAFGDPPETDITSGPSGTTTSTDASLTFTSSDPASTFECRLDADTFAACTSPRALSGLSQGAHSFEVRAIDSAGNVDPTPAVRAWTVVKATEATPTKLADLPNPVLGQELNVQRLSGVVLIGIPAGAAGSADGRGARASQKGIKFVPLSQVRRIPVGSILNTRKGSVRLQSARNRRGARQNGDFTKGLFQVLQSRKTKAKGLTEVRLKGSSFKSCKIAQGPSRHRLGLTQDPPAACEHPRALPHTGAQLIRHRPRHEVGDDRPLRRHPHHRLPRQGRRTRLPPQEDHRRRGGQELPRKGREVAVPKPTPRNSSFDARQRWG